MIAASLVLNVLIIDDRFFVEVTGCFRVLQGGFEGRYVCIDNVAYNVIV